jgi:hypothetical protein
MAQFKQLTAEDVTFDVTITRDEIPVRGNASAIDDTTDNEIASEIEARLNSGDDTAWCVVTVTVTAGEFEGRDSMGAVCIPVGVDSDDYAQAEGMFETALADLNNAINAGEFSEPALALAQHLGCSPALIQLEGADDRFSCETEQGEWMVLTDSEADEAFKASVESYVDDCVLAEIPEAYRNYFDVERFTRDVELGDGRGPRLAGYDGAEECETIDGTDYFIYRIG